MEVSTYTMASQCDMASFKQTNFSRDQLYLDLFYQKSETQKSLTCK